MAFFSRSKKKKVEEAPQAAPTSAVQSHDHAAHAHESEVPVARRPEPSKTAVGIGAASYIVRPLVTEKSTNASAHRTYAFVVRPQASKGAIKEAIEKIYGVRVTHVRTSRYDGKKVRVGRVVGTRSAWKKAFVTVAQGQSITIA